MTISGDAVSTEARPLGSELVQDAAVRTTALVVDFAADFNEDGGTLILNGATLAYTSVDHDTETITLAAELAVSAFTDDFVAQVEDGSPGVVWTTNVTIDEGDPVPAVLPTPLVGYFPEGEADDSAGVEMVSTGDAVQVASRPQQDSMFDGGAVWNPRSQRTMKSTVVPNDTWTTVTSWTDVDVDGVTSGTTATILYDGSYMVLARVSLPANATGRRGVRILFNDVVVETELRGAEPTGITHVGIFESVRAIADDTIDIQIYQSAGGPLTVTGGSVTIFRISS